MTGLLGGSRRHIDLNAGHRGNNRGGLVSVLPLPRPLDAMNDRGVAGLPINTGPLLGGDNVLSRSASRRFGHLENPGGNFARDDAGKRVEGLPTVRLPW